MLLREGFRLYTVLCQRWETQAFRNERLHARPVLFTEAPPTWNSRCASRGGAPPQGRTLVTESAGDICGCQAFAEAKSRNADAYSFIWYFSFETQIVKVKSLCSVCPLDRLSSSENICGVSGRIIPPCGAKAPPSTHPAPLSWIVKVFRGPSHSMCPDVRGDNRKLCNV